MSEQTNPRLKKLLLEVVENQLRNNDPPITRITFDRLISDGYTKAEAKERIAAAVIGQIYDMLRDGKSFNLEEYESELNSIR